MIKPTRYEFEPAIERLLQHLHNHASIADRAATIQALRAVCVVLAEAIPASVTLRVRKALPAGLRDWFKPLRGPVRMNARTFVWRVATVAHIGVASARDATRVVLCNLAVMGGVPVAAALHANLPTDCRQLLQPAGAEALTRGGSRAAVSSSNVSPWRGGVEPRTSSA